MPERSSKSRCGLGRRSCFRPRLLIACTAVSVAALTLIATLEASIATTLRDAKLPVQTVNRTLKSDRLFASGVHLKNIKKPRERAPQPRDAKSKLPDGCEALVSPAADKRLARIPGRCVS